MSTKFEFHLCKFLDYCNGSNDYACSEMFEDIDFIGYDIDYVVAFYHNRIDEIFNVN